MTLNSIETFCGGGGLALGFELAGIHPLLLVDKEPTAIGTIRTNRPKWHAECANTNAIKFHDFRGLVDVVSGGFPCQPFSYRGNGHGLGDIRGTAFFDFCRAISEISPPLFICENVRGLFSHDNRRTFITMKSYLESLGYKVFFEAMRADHYFVPQKRKRIFVVGIRNDLPPVFSFPIAQAHHNFVLADALKAGRLYSTDAPKSDGFYYKEKKRRVMDLVPMGGNWRDLPDEIAREYMEKSYYSSGGRTSYARRLSWDKPSPTLVTHPAQKSTELCHPEETRPLSIREYARIQTFPDEWKFCGSISSQYRQIGNAVPVNMAQQIANQIVKFFMEVDIL